MICLIISTCTNKIRSHGSPWNNRDKYNIDSYNSHSFQDFSSVGVGVESFVRPEICCKSADNFFANLVSEEQNSHGIINTKGRSGKLPHISWHCSCHFRLAPPPPPPPRDRLEESLLAPRFRESQHTGNLPSSSPHKRPAGRRMVGLRLKDLLFASIFSPSLGVNGPLMITHDSRFRKRILHPTDGSVGRADTCFHRS